MGKRPGAKYAVIKRLDALMADGEKRSEAKAAAGLRGESLFAFTDNRIHAFESRSTYQKANMRFVVWCGEQHNLRDLDRITERADELASLYLTERIEQGKSAWTLQTERSALRMLFQNRQLTESVELPKRKRENITRSRLPTVRDKHINLANWQHIIQFCLACGLRREELRDLHVRDVLMRPDDRLVIHVVKGKGGKVRDVPVFPGREQAVLSVIKDKGQDEHVFTRISGLLDIHSYRRQFAQELYEHLSGRSLPPPDGRIQPGDVDKEVVLYVSRCLGHNRIDVIFKYYIR
jgi:integrase